MRLVVCVVALLSTAGCLDAEPDPAAPLETSAGTPPSGDAVPSNTTSGALPRASVDVPVEFAGNTGVWFLTCVSAAGRCAALPFALVAADGDKLIEDVRGEVLGGNLTLAWNAASPATTQMAFGAMLMDGGEGCEPVDLGSVSGASPLVLDLASSGRPLCEGEVVHVWVSTTTYGDAGAGYYQVVVDQDFQVTGLLRMSAPETEA